MYDVRSTDVFTSHGEVLVAALESSFDLSRDVVLQTARAFAATAEWQTAPRRDGCAVAFVRRRFSLAASEQEILVFVEADDAGRSVVVVETQAKTWFGTKQMFDWGQGRRLATSLLDAIAERADDRRSDEQA